MDVLREGMVKIRKEQICHGCIEKLPKGTEIYHQAIADGGTAYSVYMCQSCRAWCSGKKCHDCYDWDGAHEGFIAECKRESQQN